MDAERFDALTRLIGSRISRRVAVGLTVTGLLSVTVPDAEALKCSKQKPCPACKWCTHKKCKPDPTQDRLSGRPDRLWRRLCHGGVLHPRRLPGRGVSRGHLCEMRE